MIDRGADAHVAACVWSFEDDCVVKRLSGTRGDFQLRCDGRPIAMRHQDSSRAFEVTQEEVTDFRRDGAVCLRQLLTSEEVELLREGIEANLRSPSSRAKIA